MSCLVHSENLYLGNNQLVGPFPLALCELPLIENLEAGCNIDCPCCTDADDCIADLSARLAEVSPDGGIAMNMGGTPQNQSFAWLVQDNRLTPGRPVSQLEQRYSLATLYYSTVGAEWANQFGFLTTQDECEWYTGDEGESVCIGPDIFNLNFNSNNLQGTLPDELVLLDGLRKCLLLLLLLLVVVVLRLNKCKGSFLTPSDLSTYPPTC